MDREQADHVYHPWNLTSVPKPTYMGARTTSNDAQLSAWHMKRAGIEPPWAGKSACHSPRYHGHAGMPVTMLSLQRSQTQTDIIAHDGRKMHDRQPVSSRSSGRPCGRQSGRQGLHGGSQSGSLRSGSLRQVSINTARSEYSQGISARTPKSSARAAPPLALAR